MNFERPDPLKTILERMGAAVERNESTFRNFDTDNGFRGTVSFAENGSRELTLKRDGLVSTFSIEGDDITFISLRGPDDEHIVNSNFVDQHKHEAERLMQESQLERDEPFDIDEDGQYQML